MGAQWLSGRLLDSRPKGRGFEPHRRHCVVSLSKNINPSLVLVQPRKTRPFITERLLMGRKESNQTNKTCYSSTYIHCVSLSLCTLSKRCFNDIGARRSSIYINCQSKHCFNDIGAHRSSIYINCLHLHVFVYKCTLSVYVCHNVPCVHNWLMTPDTHYSSTYILSVYLGIMYPGYTMF